MEQLPCSEDIITLDPINVGEPFVQYKDKCVKCETIPPIRNGDIASYFNENPIKALFYEDATPEEINVFWEYLEYQCHEKRPETQMQELPAQMYMAEPDYSSLSANMEILKGRIRAYYGDSDSANSSIMFFEILHRVALLPHDIITGTVSAPSPRRYTSQIRKILFDRSCISQMVHDPVPLPLNIQMFIEKLSSSPEDKFREIIEYLNTKPGLCLEGIIETCNKMLDLHGSGGGSIRGGKKRHIKTKRRSNKLNKRRKTTRKRKTK